MTADRRKLGINGEGRRKFPRDRVEGLCSGCGDFGPIDLNIGSKCETCAALLREEK